MLEKEVKPEEDAAANGDVRDDRPAARRAPSRPRVRTVAARRDSRSPPRPLAPRLGALPHGPARVWDFGNIDELFDLEKGSFYAVKDCFCEKTWSHTPQYKIGYRVSWPERELGPPPPLYFNAGMFVHEPSLGTAKDDLLDALVVTPSRTSSTSSSATSTSPSRTFTGKEPNMEREDIKTLVQKWSDIYDDASLDYQQATDDDDAHQPLRQALSEAGSVKYVIFIQDEKSLGLWSCSCLNKLKRFTGKEPNMDRDDIKTLVQKWWDIYDDASLDYPLADDDDDACQPLRQARQVLPRAVCGLEPLYLLVTTSA
ncbi:hypothetical protein EJB05_38454, partial [Eragrostis curvula]